MTPPNIYAVIVTYHPDADFLQNLNAVLPQITGAIIVDNGGDLPPLPAQSTLIQNTTNIGLAAAQNQGIARALELNTEWVLLLDDDSIPKPDMIEKMLTAYEANPKKNTIGLVAPRIHDRQINKTYRVLTGGKWWFSTRSNPSLYTNDLVLAIASGSLIKREVFQKIGLMREAYFIDRVDTEFCARLLTNGYCMMSAGDAMLYHALGNSEREGNIIRKNYSPQRYYTQFRNTFWLVREYGIKLPAYAVLNLGSLLLEIFRVVAYEQDKSKKLKAICKGIKDGITLK
jgi:rhamnosyltransferase